MASRALQRWNTTSAKELDQIAGAHAAVGGTKPGRRYATGQINHAYVVLLAAAFQRFCRDLHTESINVLIGHVKPPPPIETVLLAMVLRGRQLDSKNATVESIGADFNTLGVPVMDALRALRPTNQKRLAELGRMNGWRNAIAHQDFDRKKLAPAKLHLEMIATWRRQCGILAVDLDTVMLKHLTTLVGTPPW